MAEEEKEESGHEGRGGGGSEMEGKRIEEESRFECPVSFRRAGCSLVPGGRLVSVIQFMRPWTDIRVCIRAHCARVYVTVRIVYIRTPSILSERREWTGNRARSEYFCNWIKSILESGRSWRGVVSSWFRRERRETMGIWFYLVNPPSPAKRGIIRRRESKSSDQLFHLDTRDPEYLNDEARQRSLIYDGII